MTKIYVLEFRKSLARMYMNCNGSKPTFMRLAKTQIAFAQSDQNHWTHIDSIAKDAKFLHAENEGYNQTARMHRLIFVGRAFLTLWFLKYSRLPLYRLPLSRNRLSRSENLVPVLTRTYLTKENKILWKKRIVPKELFLLPPPPPPPFPPTMFSTHL